MKKFALILLFGSILMGCSQFKSQRMDGVVAEYRGEYVTQAEILALTAGLSKEDSARVATQYIRQWLTNILIWNEAKLLNTKEIERKVADYHRSLCLYEWEQHMVNLRMPHQITDSTVLAFYEENKNHFILHNPIVEGILLVVPNGAPNMDKLREYIVEPSKEENIEWIEKYAYQYATGYELFLEEWKTSDHLMQCVPFDKKTFNRQLKQQKQIEVQDSINTYLLQVTNVCHPGDYAPLNYVRNDIEKLLLSQRQVDFLNTLRDELYNRELEKGGVKIYSIEDED